MSFVLLSSVLLILSNARNLDQGLKDKSLATCLWAIFYSKVGENEVHDVYHSFIRLALTGIPGADIGI